MTSLNLLSIAINKTFSRRKVISLLVTLNVVIQGCEPTPQWNPIEKSVLMMDTFISIRVFDEKPPALINEAIDAAIDRMKTIEQLSSSFDSTSEIFHINQTAAKQFVTLSKSVQEILTIALEVEKRSKGAFTVTIAPLMHLWGFGYSESFSVPAQHQIDSCLALVGAKWIELRDSTIHFKKNNVALHLGGIAKGYAVDQAIEILENAGIENALVDAGGDLRALAGELTRGKRRVYVRHPRERREFLGNFQKDKGAVATSGDYERYFVFDSVRYHHILDPKTGYPGRKCASVTVVAPSCALADALSTALFILGPDQGMSVVNQWQEVEALFITEKNSRLDVVTTSGLDHFEKK
jgi:thiamine biosynthesis lipoprotein